MNDIETRPSISQGIPLTEEKGIGALTLGGYLREIVGRYGSREAAVGCFGDREERWTYDVLEGKSLQVARALVACGIGKGSRVGILMTNRLEFLAALFGTALVGGVATPISTFFTGPELDAVLRASGCSVLLLEGRVLKKDFAALLVDLEPDVAVGKPGALSSVRFPFLSHIVRVDSDQTEGVIEGWSNFLARGDDVSPALVESRAQSVAPSDPGMLFFSSGSTGKAKGILSAHRGICLQLWRWRKWSGAGDDVRSWAANGFFWSGTFAQALGSTLTSGGTLLLQRWFDAGEALKLMERERVTMLIAWPHQWAQLEEAPNFGTTDLSALLYIDAESPIARHPAITTQWQDTRAYGNTETFTLIAAFERPVPPEVAAVQSHGLPTPGSTIKIVDPLSGNVVPLGERGEIAVKGPTLMLCYIGIPLDETLDADGFLLTGDGGYLDEHGRLFWEGRINDIIKTGGANVSPVEVDQVVRNCPGVKLSQTIGIPHETLGEIVVTCVVAHDGSDLQEEDIRTFARSQLASYKVPRRILFLDESDIELTGSAKVKTVSLRQLANDRINP